MNLAQQYLELQTKWRTASATLQESALKVTELVKTQVRCEVKVERGCVYLSDNARGKYGSSHDNLMYRLEIEGLKKDIERLSKI